MASDLEVVWSKLILDGGLTEIGAAALMGNLQAESGIIPYRIQGDFTTGYTRSKEYTAKVNSGDITRDDFIEHGPGGGGYGLAQWTSHNRKRNLYDAQMKRYGDIANLVGQVDYLITELTTSYRSVYNHLMKATNLREASNDVLINFEAPKSRFSEETQSTRAKNGSIIYSRMTGKTLSSEELMAVNSQSRESIMLGYDDSGLTQQVSYVDTDISEIIDPLKLKPFVAFIDSDTPNINYDILKEARVCTVMFDAGSLFDSAHITTKYKEQTLYKQVISAAKVDFPFGIIVHSKASSLSEAKDECKELGRIINKYPPPMGLWIHPQFPRTQGASKNNSILEYYFTKCVMWGLRGACGLYCDRSELERIDWKNNFKNKFFLWYVNPCENIETEVASTILFPEFFKVGGEYKSV